MKIVWRVVLMVAFIMLVTLKVTAVLIASVMERAVVKFRTWQLARYACAGIAKADRD